MFTLHFFSWTDHFTRRTHTRPFHACELFKCNSSERASRSSGTLRVENQRKGERSLRIWSWFSGVRHMHTIEGRREEKKRTSEISFQFKCISMEHKSKIHSQKHGSRWTTTRTVSAQAKILQVENKNGEKYVFFSLHVAAAQSIVILVDRTVNLWLMILTLAQIHVQKLPFIETSGGANATSLVVLVQHV